MDALPAVLLAIGIVSWIWKLTRRPARPKWTVPQLVNELDRLETMLLRQEIRFASSSLAQIDPPIMRVRGPDGCLLRARLRLSAGDFFAWTGRPEPARARLEEAL